MDILEVKYIRESSNIKIGCKVMWKSDVVRSKNIKTITNIVSCDFNEKKDYISCRNCIGRVVLDNAQGSVCISSCSRLLVDVISYLEDFITEEEFKI